MPNEELKGSESDRLADLPRALVLGGSLSGLIAAKALTDVGIGVTLVKGSSPTDALYCSAPGFNHETYMRDLFDAIKGVEVIESEKWPKLRRHGFGFLADFGNGNETFNGCLFVTRGVSLRPPGPNFPEGVEPVSPEGIFTAGCSVAFVLDSEPPTNPAAGMAAIRQAIENRESGGESFVLFRHAPVAHLFGESLYETAKRQGIRFYRCGEQRTEIVAIPPHDESGRRFRVTFQAMIGGDDQVVLDCDRVLVAGGPDPASIPRPMIEIVEHDLNEEGFLLSSSTHCHSGRSFRNGIFAVGESTGEVDLIRTTAQAAAAAASARAWMLEATARQETDTVIFTEECIRCLTCFRVCPHSAVHFQAGGARLTFSAAAALCQECGICVSECPRLVLDLTSLPEEAIRSFLEEIEKVQNSRPIIVYGCVRSAGRAAAQIKMPQGVLFFSVPCTGRVSEPVLWATLAAGARGVLVVGCHRGNCSSDTGTDWARARVESVADKLSAQQAALVPVKFVAVAANETARFGRIVGEFCSSLQQNTDPVGVVS